MAIVRHMTRPVNVIEVVQEKDPHQEDDTLDQVPIVALSFFQIKFS